MKQKQHISQHPSFLVKMDWRRIWVLASFKKKRQIWSKMQCQNSKPASRKAKTSLINNKFLNQREDKSIS